MAAIAAVIVAIPIIIFTVRVKVGIEANEKFSLWVSFLGIRYTIFPKKPKKYKISNYTLKKIAKRDKKKAEKEEKKAEQIKQEINTEEEKKEAREKAIKRLEEETYQSMRKPAKKVQISENKTTIEQGSLF